MINSIREMYKKVKTEEELLDQFDQFDEALEKRLDGLERFLGQSLLSTDVTNIMQHISVVESKRETCNKFLALVKAFAEYSKGERFRLKKDKEEGKVTADEQSAHARMLSAGWSAWEARLEQTIRGIDSRVNLGKKILGIEEEHNPRNTVRGSGQ